MGLKLFVDDMRECPKGWVPAKSVTEAIRLLSTVDFEEVSLDHDIACRLVDGHEHSSNETFEPVAWFLLLANKPIEIIKVRIHTSNVAAGRRMAEIMGIDYNNEIYDPRDYDVQGSHKENQDGTTSSDTTVEDGVGE